jgi:hypothetical protein
MPPRPVVGLLAVSLFLVISPVRAVADAANHEGVLEQVQPVGLGSLSVRGWARDLGSATPVRVEILVNSIVRTTVTANLPRKDAAANGFAATISAPSQPGSVCARTVAARPLSGVVVGCRRLPFGVPIRVVTEAAQPPPLLPGQVASFFWVNDRGEVAKDILNAPIVNGVALYSGDPLPRGLKWAITVHDPTGRPLFRSGPLAELPGPSGAVALTRRINVFRSLTPASFGLNSGDGAPELVTQRLRLLPSALRVDSVRLTADSAGHEVVVVRGIVKRLIVSHTFVYSLPVTIRPASDPGHPADVIVAVPAGPATGTVAALGSYASVLDRAILEGVDRALEVAVKRIAAIKLELAKAGFPATLVSVTSIELRPSVPDPSVVVQVHAGAITGDSGSVVTEG